VYNVHVDDVSPSSALRFSRSQDGGTSWLVTPVVVDATSYVGPFAALVNQDTSVYACYFDWTGAVGQLRFAASTDRGDTWSAPVVVDSEGDTGYSSSLALAGDVLYAVYHRVSGTGGSLRLASSDDWGASWNIGAVVDEEQEGDTGSYCRLVASGGVLYVCYQQADTKLKFAWSSDGGLTWDGIGTVVDEAAHVGKYSSLAVSGSEVYISYYDETNGDLKFARSMDGGTSW
jgi:hypothetical protein